MLPAGQARRAGTAIRLRIRRGPRVARHLAGLRGRSREGRAVSAGEWTALVMFAVLIGVYVITLLPSVRRAAGEIPPKSVPDDLA